MNWRQSKAKAQDIKGLMESRINVQLATKIRSVTKRPHLKVAYALDLTMQRLVEILSFMT